MLPVFLLILSGILDFGFMLNARMTVISAAREGARAALNVKADSAAEFATIDGECVKEGGVVTRGVVRCRVADVIVGTGLTAGDLATTTTCVKGLPAPPPHTLHVHGGGQSGG